jgi:hypothetical protein
VHSVNLPDSSLVQYDSTASPSSVEETPRAWWFAKDDSSLPGGKRYEGLDETWKLLQDLLESETFDVVLGFSQGAALTPVLSSQARSWSPADADCLMVSLYKVPP